MGVSTNKSTQNAKKKINNIYKQTNIKGSSINNYWTEKEDDILTRTIQKYGINKWNKIATLLMKKSAIQCKLRWEEYLSPKFNNTKQVQFNPDEDKQLIDLYQLYRDQWKTIADVMGKTASSCLNRYNELISGNTNESIFDINDLGGTSKDQKKSSDITTMLTADSIAPQNKPDGMILDNISHDAEQRLVANLDKKKIKKMKADRDFLEMITNNIESRRNALKIGMKNKTLKLPNQVMKYKNLTELLTNDHLKYPPKGIYDTTKELEENKKLLLKFEALIKKKGVYQANKELGFDHIYQKRELKREAEKIKPQVQIGKVRNFKVGNNKAKTEEDISQEKVMNKIKQIKPLITSRILERKDGSILNKTGKCLDNQLVEKARSILESLSEPLNDFEIDDGNEEEASVDDSNEEEASLDAVKEEEKEENNLDLVKKEQVDDINLIDVKSEDNDFILT